MKNFSRKNLFLLAMLGLLVASLALAGENVWVSDDGNKHHVGGDAMFIADGDGFDVADLRDGETRMFGKAPKQISATRDGDEVPLSRPAADGKGALDVVCRVGRDSCKVVTFDADPEKIALVIEKSRECVNGVGDCDEDVVVSIDDMHLGNESAHVVIEKILDCDGDDCEENIVRVLGGAGEGMAQIELLHDGLGDADGKKMVFVHAGGSGDAVHFGGSKTMLRCPEGDAMIHVDRDEVDETFLCPKHSVPMEKSGGSAVRRIRVKKGHD